VSDEIRAIALRCGAEFGLNLYGLDVLETAGGPLVIDVNYFPSYKGVPDAASRLADDIHACAHARLAAQPAPAPAPVARTV
jgi:ribosomal protein S6--L-glutamate ligase